MDENQKNTQTTSENQETANTPKTQDAVNGQQNTEAETSTIDFSKFSL
jgi:hypothetical protein